MPEYVVIQPMADHVQHVKRQQRKRTRALIVGWLLFLGGMYALYNILWNWVHV